MDTLKEKKENEKIRELENLTRGFEWKDFDLDKFFKDANKVGKILEKREKANDNER